MPVLNVVVTGLGRTIRWLPRLLAIYGLPWLLGTIALLILEVVAQEQLQLAAAPDWARNLVWAPFSAMANLMLLRWVLDDVAPTRPLNVLAQRETWLAALVLALWFLSYPAISHAPLVLLQWLVFPEDLRDRFKDVLPYYFAFTIAAWLVNAALAPCFFGLIVVVARSGWLNVGEYWRLLRLHPARLLSVALIATAAVDGVAMFDTLAWLQLAPGGLIPGGANIGWAFLAELAQFPVQFLEFAIKGCILAEAYRRLLAETKRCSPTDVGN